MIAVSTAWNAERHAGWAPAAGELLELGVPRIALDGPALQSDAAEAGRAVRAAHGRLVALFAPAPSRDATAGGDVGGLVDVRADRRAAAVAAALAAGRAALAAGTVLVILRTGAIPVVDAAREDRWTGRLGREGATDALRAEVAAAQEELRPHRARYLEALCRSAWELARALPDVQWCVETPATVAGLPFPDETDAFLGELRGRRVGCWHDTAHAARLGALGAADPRAWIDRAAAAVRGVTVSDWLPPLLGSGGRAPPGVGTVDWAVLRGQLASGMERVLRLPAEFPRGAFAEALRQAESLAG
jgi:sugar phosphate isomerase/epimerase